MRIPFLAWSCASGILVGICGGTMPAIGLPLLAWSCAGIVLGIAYWASEGIGAGGGGGGLGLVEAMAAVSEASVAIPGHAGIYVGRPRPVLDQGLSPTGAFAAAAEMIPYDRVGSVRSSAGSVAVFDLRQRTLVVSRGWGDAAGLIENAAMGRLAALAGAVRATP